LYAGGAGYLDLAFDIPQARLRVAQRNKFGERV
jgi:hypothetical protein